MAKVKSKPRRFVTKREMKVERLPWGPHDWLCRPDIIAEAEQLLLVRVNMPRGKAHEFHVHPTMEEIIRENHPWVLTSTYRSDIRASGGVAVPSGGVNPKHPSCAQIFFRAQICEELAGRNSRSEMLDMISASV